MNKTIVCPHCSKYVNLDILTHTTIDVGTTNEALACELLVAMNLSVRDVKNFLVIDDKTGNVNKIESIKNLKAEHRMRLMEAKLLVELAMNKI